MRFARRKKKKPVPVKKPPPIRRQKPDAPAAEGAAESGVASREPAMSPGAENAPSCPTATRTSPAPDAPPTDSPSTAPSSTSGSEVSEIKYGGKTFRLDIGASIREKALKVRPSELASKHSEVQVLGMGAVMKLIEGAVDEALQLVEHDWNEAERRKLLEEAEEEFRARLQAEKADSEARARLLQEQLHRAQSVLEEERKKVVTADQFTVSDAGIIELEKRLSRLIDRSLQKGGVTAELEQEMRDTFARLLDDEREKITEKEREAQNASISLLERKIHRLSQSLEDTEQARKRAEKRAHALETAQGNFIAGNIYDVGLDEDDPQKEQKLQLLKEIVENNRDVRDFMAKAGVLPARHEGAAAAEGATEDVALEQEELPRDEGEHDESREGEESEREESEREERIVSAEVAVSDSPGIKKITLKTVQPPPLEEVRPRSEPKQDVEELVDRVPVLVSRDRAAPEVDPDDCLWEPPE